MSQTCLIIGSSHAAAQLATSLRQHKWAGKIVIIGDEGHLPYHRPPLSKGFLLGEKTAESLSIRPAQFYADKDIELMHDTVTHIDRDNRTVSLASGSSLHYDKLALCTGSRVRKLPIEGNDLDGVHYLRNLDDVLAIQQNIAADKTAVIIGGGYIGLETAAALSQAGMTVTVVEQQSRLLARVATPVLSEFFTRLHTEHGVTIMTDTVVERLEGQDKKVTTVCCQDGKRLSADMVIIGVGVIPNVELAKEAGLDVDNGVVVDAYCRTSDANIVAAGDCTSCDNVTYQQRMRLESVPNAMEQGKTAAMTLCGMDKPNTGLPWFWSDQYDVKLQMVGLTQGHDDVIMRGDIKTDSSFALFYFQEGRLIAADCVNRPQEFMLAKKILSNGWSIEPQKLKDETLSVKEISADLG